MASVRTEFILTDITGNVLGEVKGAIGAQVALPHLRLHSAQFTVPIWHPRANDLTSVDTILRVYRTDQLGTRRITFAGPVVSVEENGASDAQTIAVNAVNPFWRLTKRLIGTSKAGFSQGSPAGPGNVPPQVTVDLGLMMHNILDATNGAGFTGLSKGTLTNSNGAILSQIWMKNVAEQIAELAASINGPEFGVRYTDPVIFPSGPFPQLAVLDVAPVIGGVTRDDAIFEYGTGKTNVASYTRARTLDGVMTKGWISLSGWPDGTLQDLRVFEDTAASAARGLYEDIVPDGGVTDDGLRDGLVQAHVGVRKTWRQVITFTPSVNARPGFQTDYNVGDYIRARAVVKGTVRFDAIFRVWGVTLSYDDNGNEQAELELVLP